MNPLLLPLLDIGSKVFDKLFPDPVKADEAKLKMLEMAQKGELDDLTARAGIVQAEAQSEHWLTSTWRPITMLTFTGLIVARWFGWSAPGMTEAELLKLWDIVHVGLGGYVGMRSIEKIAPSVLEVFKNRK